MEKEWFDQLTDAQKAKLKAMDGEVTIDRLIAFCKEEKLDLIDQCGIKDPTPYLAVKNIIRKERAAACAATV